MATSITVYPKYISYTENTSFTYNSQSYDHSLALQFTSYKLDKFGRKVREKNPDNPSEPLNKDLYVRSYYTITGVDANINGMPLTIEDLVTLLAVKRANVLEKEVTPMATIIENRNKRIEDLGTLLASVAQTQSKLESQEEGEDKAFDCKGLSFYLKQYFTQAELEKANLWDWIGRTETDADNHHMSLQVYPCATKKSEGIVASANQLIKAKIDSLNNDAQSDLSRMDNLVSKRDEAYTLSTDLLSKFSDGRSNIINNMK